MKKYLIRIFVTGFVLCTGFALVFFFYPFDIEPQDYSHLKRELRNVPKEQNAFYEYIAIHEELKTLGAVPSFKEGDEATREKFIKENNTLLNHLDKAVSIDYEEPDFSADDELSLRGLSARQKMSQLFELRLKVELNTMVLKAFKEFTEKTQSSVNSLVSGLANIDSQSSYLRVAFKVLNRKSLRINESFSLSDKSIMEHFNKSLDAEKFYFLSELEVVNALAKKELSLIESLLDKSEYSYQKNQYFRDYYKYLDEQKIAIDESYVKQQAEPESVWTYLMPGGMNKALFLLAKPSIDKSRWKAFEQLCLNKILRTAIACRLYELDHKTLPKDLNELVPKYLAKVPMDNFDGQPLKYDFESKKIYSVAKDGVDNGGSMEGDQYFGSSKAVQLYSSKDLVFQFTR